MTRNSVDLGRRNLLRILTGGAVAGAAFFSGLDSIVSAAFAQEQQPEPQSLRLGPKSYDTDVYNFFYDVEPALSEVFGLPMHLSFSSGSDAAIFREGGLSIHGGTGSSLTVYRLSDIEEYGPTTQFRPVQRSESKVLAIDKVGDRYVVSSGANYVGRGSSPYAYVTSGGTRAELARCVTAVKAWQDAYDALFERGKEVYKSPDLYKDPEFVHVAQQLGMVPPSSLSPKQVLELKLNIILDIYKKEFMRLADNKLWPNIRIRPESRDTLQRLAKTYTTDDVKLAIERYGVK